MTLRLCYDTLDIVSIIIVIIVTYHYCVLWQAVVMCSGYALRDPGSPWICDALVHTIAAPSIELFSPHQCWLNSSMLAG